MANRQEQFIQFRKTYPVFRYKSYHYGWIKESFSVEFHFAVCNEDGSEVHHFRPTIKIPPKVFYKMEEVPEPLLKNLVFHCGMVELVSYWKCCCPPKVEIECGYLDEAQKEWFRKLYFLGLGEFFYLNGISTSRQDFMRIECAGNAERFQKEDSFCPKEEKIMVPVGGGKDSVVSLEILRRLPGTDIRPMIINPRGATRNCCLQAGFSDQDCIVVERSIDKTLLNLNAQGFLNGHTPFSAMLAFTSLVTAALSQSRHIALSNENSANESTVPGQQINHQYSKSLEFENDFRQYVGTYISPGFNYFSFLRPLSEIGIARLFSSLPQYHSVFRSCNAGSKTDSWCGKCPKCLFAFIILAPFMGIEKTSRLFGKNLFDDSELVHFLDELTGIAPVKPFECVGTVSEVHWALQQMKTQAQGHCLLEHYFAQKNLPATTNRTLNEYSTSHNLNPQFNHLLQEAVEKVKSFESESHRIEIPCPQPVRETFGTFFSKAEKIAIVGMGREGRSTYRLIRRIFPQKPLIVVDLNEKTQQEEMFKTDCNLRFLCGKDYLEKLQDAETDLDLIIKTPGISLKNHPALLNSPKLSSQTALFLKAYAPKIIGITGTKGKSTTTLLTHHLLSPYKPCILAGNMGIPLFDIVDEIGPDTCIVCEFSAHQLEQARKAPHIGVLLNLYEEHLDHYRSFEHYQRAKANIAGDPAEDTVVFYNDDSLVRQRINERVAFFKAEKESGRMLTYSLQHPVAKGLYLKENKIKDGESGEAVFDLAQPHPLIGRHNLLNLMAALLAAHATGVDYKKLTSRIASFTPLPHRLQYVGCIGERHYFNDSISTIPQAAIEAVKSVEQLPFVQSVDCLILGGLDRGIDYSPIADFLSVHPLPAIVFVGAAGKRIYEMLQKRNVLPRQFLLSDNYPELVEWAIQNTRPGHACILSPAAASYDQFVNFAQRGNVFMELCLKTRQ